MSGWARYLALTAKAKTGVSPGIHIGAALAAAFLVATLVFVSLALFVLLAEYVGPLRSALIMSGGFLVLAIIAAVATVSARRRAMARAQQALAAQAASLETLTLGLKVGQILGWRRLAPIAAVALIAASLAREWGRRGKPDETADD